MPVLAVARPKSTFLAPFVASMHLAGDSSSPSLERVLPDGLVYLMINLCDNALTERAAPNGAPARRTSGTVLVGPHAHASVIDTGQLRCIISVDFTPGGASAFFGGALPDARERLVDLELLWGSDGAVLRERLMQTPTTEGRFAVLESALLSHLDPNACTDPLISFASAAFARGASVEAAASCAGLLRRTFARRFEAATGLPPKLYSRVLRLQRVLQTATGSSPTDWAAVATDHGYADQSHLIHDFRDLTGLTPTAYRPRSAAEHNHVPIA